MTWIADPHFIPTWRIGDTATYPSDLLIRGIAEMPEFGGLPMYSCQYVTDSPALISPEFEGARIFVPYDGLHGYNDQFSVSTDFKVLDIYLDEASGFYRYRLASVEDQLVTSESTANLYLKYASGFQDYLQFYTGMSPVPFEIIAQGLEDYAAGA